MIESVGVGALAMAIAFLIGGLPSRRVVTRLWAVDLTTVGTGNPGAGNATRSVGLRAGILVAVLDGLKGLLPILGARALGLSGSMLALIGLAAVAGNDWPVLFGRRGGRGLATSVGVILAIDPLLIWWPALWSAIGWRIGGGIAGFLGWGLLPFVALAAGAPMPTLAVSAGLAVMMALRRYEGNDGPVESLGPSRVLFDDDEHRDRISAARAHQSVVAGAAVLIIGYGLAAWWILRRPDAATLGLAGIGLLTLGIASEFGAKWMFGELFREGVSADGKKLRRASAFRAALVGAGIARLIPAGGAVTPVAMAWTVRDETPGTSGAALRATVLNYGGLLLATGGGFLWAAAWFPETPARPQIAVAGAIGLALGLAFIAGAARLRWLTRLVPARWRDRVSASLQDRAITGRTVVLLTMRVALEAAALGLTLRAFDIALSPSRTLATFGASQLVGGLPGTPGGLGFTEAGLAGALAFFGVNSAIGPILVFRFISYWAPAVAGLSTGGYQFLRTRKAETPSSDG